MLKHPLRIPKDTLSDQHTPSSSLVLRLKAKIQQLSTIILQQQATIDSLKHDPKITRIGQLQIEVQHLTHQNKRLALLAEERKGRTRVQLAPKQKKPMYSCTKITQRKTVPHEYRVQTKMYEVLKENETLKRQLVTLKINQNMLKRRTSTLNDRSSIILEKSLMEHDILLQQRIDLQAERDLLQTRVKKLQQKLGTVMHRNAELQTLHHKHIPSSMLLADY